MTLRITFPVSIKWNAASMLVFAWFEKSVNKQPKKPQKEQRVVSQGLSSHSKTLLELNHTADDIPGFH